MGAPPAGGLPKSPRPGPCRASQLHCRSWPHTDLRVGTTLRTLLARRWHALRTTSTPRRTRRIASPSSSTSQTRSPPGLRATSRPSCGFMAAHSCTVPRLARASMVPSSPWPPTPSLPLCSTAWVVYVCPYHLHGHELTCSITVRLDRPQRRSEPWVA
jgi:hypothetical protein